MQDKKEMMTRAEVVQAMLDHAETVLSDTVAYIGNLPDEEWGEAGLKGVDKKTAERVYKQYQRLENYVSANIYSLIASKRRHSRRMLENKKESSKQPHWHVDVYFQGQEDEPSPDADVFSTLEAAQKRARITYPLYRTQVRSCSNKKCEVNC